jgi:hypothetical protein
MTEIIGNGHSPLAGWVLAQCHGVLLIGRLASKAIYDGDGGIIEGACKLSPVFELKPQLIQQGQSVGTVHMAFPLWLLTVTSVELPAGALVVPCDSLSRAEQAGLMKAIEAAEQMVGQMKAAAAGITVAREMPRRQG